MNLKKFLSLFLAISIAVTMVGCGNKKDTNEYVASSNQENASSSEEIIEIESCRFANEIYAFDREYVDTYYKHKKGNVYVDVTIRIIGNTNELKESDFSGYVTYKELRNDFSYRVENENSTGLESYSLSTVPANIGGRVHLIAILPEDAKKSTDLQAHVKILDKEYDVEIEPIDTSDVLSNKIKLSKGFKESLLNGAIDFEVISCKQTKYIQALNYEDTAQYTNTASKPYIDLVLKITNNSYPKSIDKINGYSIINGDITNCATEIEIENNTDLKNIAFTGGIKQGATEYIHLYTSVDESINKEGLSIRFNLGGNCYYCPVE